MKILVINPVATDMWNVKDGEYLKGIVSRGTEIEVVSLKKGPESIETFFDEAYAAPEILKIVEESKNFDAIVINCFGNPALYAVRDIADILVLGAGETSMTIALLLGEKFGVISVLRNSKAQIEMTARRIGISERLAYAAGIKVPVLNLEKENEVIKIVIDEAKKAIDKGAEVIVLGCTGMFFLAKDIRKKLNIPVIEPASLTLKVAEALTDLRLKHSKIGLYMTPDLKKLITNKK